MDNNSNNFLDKNTLTAIILTMLVFVGWQYYVQKKYPDAYKPKIEQTQAENSQGEKVPGVVQNTPNNKPVLINLESNLGKAKEQILDGKNKTWSYKLTSLGMGFKSVELLNYSDRDDINILFEDPLKKIPNLASYYKGEPIAFSIEKQSENHYIGTAQVEGQTLIKEMKLNPDNFTVLVSMKTLTGKASGTSSIETRLSNKVLDVPSSMLTPAYEGTEFFVVDDGSEERNRIDIESGFKEDYKKTTLASIGTQYFTIAVHDQSPVSPQSQVNYNPKDRAAYVSLKHPDATSAGVTDIQFTSFIGPKKYDILKTLDPQFESMINYGMFSILSKPMLQMLKWFYGLFQNWGLAIILLTVIIRLLLLPINVSSLKSMKKMQKIQPQMKAIKEKYKDDPQRVNQETMALMKREGANPIGGCLPMLLQLPVFFALYSVLGQSVELYKSPFIFWIQDLSYKDPFFVLPIAVGGLYFIQMSITPQPTDPTQAKMMKFVPLLFCFFMITVPSGLTLYFFVNTIFGIGQSFIFQREKRKAAA
jgi:YidC/Oxa1 family membrane protein insertase